MIPPGPGPPTRTIHLWLRPAHRLDSHSKNSGSDSSARARLTQSTADFTGISVHQRYLALDYVLFLEPRIRGRIPGVQLEFEISRPPGQERLRQCPLRLPLDHLAGTGRRRSLR